MSRIVFDPDVEVADEATRACSTLTRTLAEPPIGRTATRSAGWLLFEDPGSWGTAAAARSPRLPEQLRELAAERGVRLQLIRRHGPRRGPRRTEPRVIAAWVGRDGPWAEVGELADPLAIGEHQLDALAAGRSPGLGEPCDAPIVLVCTHGGVDPCCARFGRPVAAALADRFGEMVWESSHVGGCRFAANVVCLPAGVSYGLTTPDLAVHQVGELLAGRVVAEGLRGRAGAPAAVQVAEQAVREHTGCWGLDALQVEHVVPDGDRRRITFVSAGRRVAVDVETTRFAQRPYGCGEAGTWAPEGAVVTAVAEL